ncbi:cell division protein FtsN [Bisgaardia hudsonensis]|uniref:Cell division protein FtsN n=1 Tax=Bisgaardia hudsonensis TaxID=109472 RepID=A0A4R2MUR7_9PAST|nr:cell division protein FtsN [Bisgaardia hudsonensis]QLB13784.1 cell division protein FtsN [Bisgaardia hudsonensis]TCP11733.1 cell division protein FtsN [Bisgaardia hudsonensis]
MASKDYVSRSSKKKKTKSSRSGFLIVIVLLIIAGFGTSLYFLKEKASDVKVELDIPTKKETPKAILPSPPKEVWSYIKELETRIVPVDEKSLDKNAQLTEEQRRVLMAMEKEQREAEIAHSKQIQEQILNETQVDIEREEKDNIEERRKAAAERKRQEEQQMALERKRAEEKQKEEKRKTTEQLNTEVQTVQAKPAASEKQFGLQCGAFKNREQAEKVQASLAMSGFNARLTTSADWNRVVIGPVGNRNQANQQLSRAKSITNCVLIAM